MCFVALGCNCDRVGSLSTDCDITSGQCSCRQMYTGRQCNQCSKGFYSFPECKGWLAGYPFLRGVSVLSGGV